MTENGESLSSSIFHNVAQGLCSRIIKNDTEIHRECILFYCLIQEDDENCCKIFLPENEYMKMAQKRLDRA